MSNLQEDFRKDIRDRQELNRRVEKLVDKTENFICAVKALAEEGDELYLEIDTLRAFINKGEAK